VSDGPGRFITLEGGEGAGKSTQIARLKNDIDTRHIHTAGMSAGGLQTTWMAYARSAYIASAVPYSGGLTRAVALQDAGNVPTCAPLSGRR
jgi:poly(3-hydroxybutyrate) depolymerase